MHVASLHHRLCSPQSADLWPALASSVVQTQHQQYTDRQTDKQTDRQWCESMMQYVHSYNCKLHQGVYKFNWTNFQISRRLQEGFQEKSRTCLHCFGLLCTESTTFNGCCLPCTVFVLADTYQAGMLTPEFIVILFTRYCLSDMAPSFMTGNQCGQASYTKISRRTIKFKEISRIFRRVFKFQ